MLWRMYYNYNTFIINNHVIMQCVYNGLLSVFYIGITSDFHKQYIFIWVKKRTIMFCCDTWLTWIILNYCIKAYRHFMQKPTHSISQLTQTSDLLQRLIPTNSPGYPSLPLGSQVTGVWRATYIEAHPNGPFRQMTMGAEKATASVS